MGRTIRIERDCDDCARYVVMVNHVVRHTVTTLTLALNIASELKRDADRLAVDLDTDDILDTVAAEAARLAPTGAAATNASAALNRARAATRRAGHRRP